MLDTQSPMAYVQRNAEHLKSGFGKSEALCSQSDVWVSGDNCRADFAQNLQMFQIARSQNAGNRALKSEKDLETFSPIITIPDVTH